jgi:hypothetical protein
MNLTVYLLVLCCSLPAALAAPFAFESFRGMSTGSGIAGSGVDAFGWSAAGWTSGSDTRFQTVDPTPDLGYYISGGATIDGGGSAIQLTTYPEPVPSPLLASRIVAVGQRTTIYFSCLIRPVAVGTGSDSLSVTFSSGSTRLVGLDLKPDLSQAYFTLGLTSSGSGGGGGTILKLYPGRTYLVVLRITQPSTSSWTYEAWLNPPAAYPGNGPLSVTYSLSESNLVFDNVGLRIASTDTGGPASTAIFDELLLGFVWSDVVPPGPSPTLVPDVTIQSAAKLRWQTQSGKTYQPQYSYDLNGWFNLGSGISGNGNVKELFDSTDTDAKKFYRIQIQ